MLSGQSSQTRGAPGWNASAVPTIAGIYIGNGKVVVNGNEAGPNVRPLDFASPRQVHRYLEVGNAITVG